MQQMQERVARFNELRPSRQAFVDTRIPEHVRDIYNVIGTGVTEDPELKPAITAAEGFNITYVGAESGKGAALHSHTTVEVFIPMTGRWSVFRGDEGRERSRARCVRLRLRAGGRTLKGDRRGQWSVRVSGIRRIVFRFVTELTL